MVNELFYHQTLAKQIKSKIFNVNLEEFYFVLAKLWSKQTCVPRLKDEWSKKILHVGNVPLALF